MSELDKLLIALFRRLTPEDQAFVNELAAAMVAAQKESKARQEAAHEAQEM